MSEQIIGHVEDRRRGEGEKEVCRRRGAESWGAEKNSDGLGRRQGPRVPQGLRTRWGTSPGHHRTTASLGAVGSGTAERPQGWSRGGPGSPHGPTRCTLTPRGAGLRALSDWPPELRKAGVCFSAVVRRVLTDDCSGNPASSAERAGSSETALGGEARGCTYGEAAR